jgi:hypothetical protein
MIHRLLAACLLAGLLVATDGCDDAFIDPFDNDGRYYTLYGYLDFSMLLGYKGGGGGR